MAEKFKLYNEQGQVENPDVARRMANVENSSHEKTLGIFPASKKKIVEGERFGEAVGKDYVEHLNKAQEVSESVKSLEFFEKGVRLEVNGHSLEILGEMRPFRTMTRKNLTSFAETSGTIDGMELSKADLKKIMERLGGHIASKFSESSDEAEKAKIRQELEGKRQDELTTQNKSAIEEVLK